MALWRALCQRRTKKPAERAGLIVDRFCRHTGLSSVSVAVAQALLATLGDPPDGPVRLDEAAILQGMQHRLVEDEVAGFLLDALKRDPFRIGENERVSDLEVLNMHALLLLVECPCSAVNRIQS